MQVNSQGESVYYVLHYYTDQEATKIDNDHVVMKVYNFMFPDQGTIANTIDY